MQKAGDKKIDGEDDLAEGEDGVNGDSHMSDLHDDESFVPSGKDRFDTLLKSLIARIEFNNTLAPIQEYGRHQKKAANIKKKNKKKVD
jgi:hypothetical protein